jgi:hypothetical protein
MLCIKRCKRWCKKEKSPFQEFVDQLETQHQIEKKDMKLKEKLLNDQLESITIIV